MSEYKTDCSPERSGSLKIIWIVLTLITGCKSPSFFITPNEVNKEEVTLVYNDGSTRKGEISIFHENYNTERSYYNEFIEFKADGNVVAGKENLYSISGYWYKNDYYALKKLDIRVNNEYYLLFAKRLTPEKSKIQLYELYESGSGNHTGETFYSYYISLPKSGPLEAINTKSSQLMPFFEQKMSLLVADCPLLAQKILAKDNGYFLPQVTFNIKKHPEVLLRIINEYNTCR